MWAALASADGVTWLSIAVKALAYGTTLGAIGAVLVAALLREIGPDGRDALLRLAVLSALLAAVFTALRLPIRASFLMGGTWEGAVDPAILGLMIESPLGTSTAIRLVGLGLILCVVWRRRAGLGLALLGAVLAAASFALRGHTLGEPRVVLGVLVTLHILCLAFWIGGFAPLMRVARYDPPARAGALAAGFGRMALWAVGGVVLAGGVMLVLFDVTPPDALTSTYGQMIGVKLGLFAGVLSFAALNKLALTPALRAGAPWAAARLRLSIRLEMVLVAAVLLATAALTTLSAPPGG